MIGIFDSGVGGLSVLAKLREQAPRADIIYFGDTLHAPYGIRSQDELKKLTVSAVNKLLSWGARDIVSACNSVSSFMPDMENGTRNNTLHSLTEMTRPTVRGLLKNFAGKNIVFFATPATITSEIYQERCKEKQINATYIPISALAGAIESGAPQRTLSKIVAEAVALLPHDTDVVSLSCTHYPLIQDIFEEEFVRAGIQAEIFNPSRIVAEDVCTVSETEGTGTTRFVLSQDSTVFRATLLRLFGEVPEIEIQNKF